MQRLDLALVARGLAPSRSRAQQLIDSGAVLVNGSADRAKASLKVSDADTLELQEDVRSSGKYVSRGAIKLVEALDIFSKDGLPSVTGTHCLDVGASTGGFTQVLLEAGAAHVLALDVGHGQLDPLIAHDPRVTDMSGVNVRAVEPGDLPYAPDLVVSDVSFISLTYVLPVLAAVMRPAAHAVLLIKPQFEVGRSKLGKGGIVTREEYRQEAVERVVSCAEECGFSVRGLTPSAITGTHGNQEYLVWLER
ncbi:TlyA family RNA methyltransferase [Alloscardovia macacae]|uniref:Cell division protein FtsJ n=1 Tax=Alloscardovia macacae TaxID=1160091 RepID=A0A261F3T9_9BIFI|nr:TlyA family RNA methyltransferase [Alloscardovia macacae]OZG53586.1 cell division protein FtsJ [Alloscardovia macacae]